MAINYFPNLILLRTGILQNFRSKMSTNMRLSNSFFGTLLVGPVTLCFSHHFILSIAVKVLVSFTGKNKFSAFDASLQGLTERADRFETIKDL